MTKTFKVTIEAKRGAVVSGSAIQMAVSNTDPTNESYKWVEVEECIDFANTALVNPLFALGRKKGQTWNLLDFFNSEKKAENALQRSVDKLLRCFIKTEVAILEFSPSVGVWRVVGKPVKV